MELLRQKQIVNQMYECNMSEEHVLQETGVYLASIEKWLQEHVKIPLGSSGKSGQNGAVSTMKNFQISNVCDIEESIW